MFRENLFCTNSAKKKAGNASTKTKKKTSHTTKKKTIVRERNVGATQGQLSADAIARAVSRAVSCDAEAHQRHAARKVATIGVGAERARETAQHEEAQAFLH
jgi:hypothetical protein